MKHCKIILLAGLLASSASALAEKIGVSMAYFDQNFLTIIRQSIEKEANARHVDVQFEDARGDTGRQADQVQSFIASGVDAIIVDPVDSASTPQLTKMAQQARMPLVYVNRTPGDKTLPPGVVFVGSDERESGTLQMEALAKTLADANDKYLRLAAEYDNYRKRTAREKEHLYNDAKIDTIKPFLAVLDNLERGVSQFEEGDAHRQGLELICKQFEEVLTKLNVAEIPALGEKFDPEKHNAVMHTEDETAAENTVVEVFQKGYTLGDKILRFAMVKVAN